MCPCVSFRYRVDKRGRMLEVYISPNAEAFSGFRPPRDLSVLRSLM